MPGKREKLKGLVTGLHRPRPVRQEKTIVQQSAGITKYADESSAGRSSLDDLDSQQSAQARAQPSSSSVQATSEAHGPVVPDLWTDALNSLPADQQEWMRNRCQLNPSGQSGSDVVEQIRLLTVEKRDECEQKRWKFTFRGEQIILRDIAEKVIVLLNKFKERAVQESQQMGSMLLAIEKITYLISQCSFYELLYLYEQDLDDSSKNLKTTVIKLYTTLFEFIIRAYEFFKQNSLNRVLNAAFGVDKVHKFFEDAECLKKKIDREARLCESVQRHSEHKEAKRERLLLKGLLEGMNEPIVRTDKRVAELLKQANKSELSEILRWVSRVPYEDNHRAARAAHVEGTGQWVIEHKKYSEWRKSSASTILWLHGIPGAGKTKLVTSVVEDLIQAFRRQSHDEALVYFYCNHSEIDCRSPLSVLQSFVKQLAKSRHRDAIQSSLVHTYEEKKRSGFASNQLNEQECQGFIQQFVDLYPQTTITLDALDECDPRTRKGLIDALVDIVDHSEKPVTIFISGRLDDDIKYRLETRANIGINATDNQEDIANFVDKRLSECDRDRRNKLIDNLRQEIVETVLRKSKGMFQWAYLQVNQLLDLRLESAIRDRLGKLPRGLSAAYDEIYKEIREQETSIYVIRAFYWVMQAVKPLSPDQLVAAVCQDPSTRGADPVDIQMDDILHLCKNLLVVDQQPSVCRFSHFSVREYLEQYHLRPEQADYFISMVSLRLLLDDDWQIASLQKFSERYYGFDGWRVSRRGTEEFKLYQSIAEESLDRYQDARCNMLLRYVMLHWQIHVRRCEDLETKEPLTDLLMEFLGHPLGRTARYVEWLNVCYFTSRDFGHYEWLTFTGTEGCFCFYSRPIAIMCMFGFHSVLYSWRTVCPRVFGKYEEGIILAQYAMLAGEMNLCKRLVTACVDMDTDGLDGDTLLTSAAHKGGIDIIQLLLSRGADVNPEGRNYRSALHAASAEGHLEVVRLLLDRGADVNHKDGDDMNALFKASWSGHLEVVRLLLDRGADRSECSYALSQASECGYLEVVRLLLDRGVSVNQDRDVWKRALQSASTSGHLEVVKLLLDCRTNANQEHRVLGIALRAASSGGHLEVVRLLLDCGADVNQKWGEGEGEAGTALQLALHSVRFPRPPLGTCRRRGPSDSDYLEIIALLLDHGADVNQEGEAVRLLLDHKADVNEGEQDYSPALESALDKGHHEIAELLVSRGVERRAQLPEQSHSGEDDSRTGEQSNENGGVEGTPDATPQVTESR